MMGTNNLCFSRETIDKIVLTFDHECYLDRSRATQANP